MDPFAATSPRQRVSEQTNPERAPIRSRASSSSIFTIAVAASVSILAAIVLVRLPPLLVSGAVISILGLVVILKRPYWGLILYTVVFVMQPGERFLSLAPLRLERIIGLVALISMLLAQYRRDRCISIDRTRQTTLLVVFFFAAALSVPLAIWRAGAKNGLIELMKALIFYLLLVQLTDSKRRFRTFVWMFSALTLYTTVLAMRDYLSGSYKIAQGISRAVGETSLVGDPNALGTTIAALIPLLFCLATLRGHLKGRWFFVAGLPLLLITLAVTGSRASLLAFLGSLVSLWCMSRRRILPAIFGLFFLVSGYYLLPEQYKTRYATITQDELDESSKARLNAWKAGLRMVLDHPVFGVGITCFSIAHALEYSGEGRRSWLQPHSLYVQVPSETGLLGATSFFAFLMSALYLNRRTAQQMKRMGHDWSFEGAALNGLLAGLIALIIAGLFGHSLLRRTWYIYAALGVCIHRLAVAELSIHQSHGGISGSCSGDSPIRDGSTFQNLSPRGC